MRTYTPRRAGKKRWLEGAPEYVLDCFYSKSYNSNDILFTGSLLGTFKDKPQDFANVYIMGLEVDPNGAWCSFELNAYEAARYRYSRSHDRVKWAGLPKEVKGSVARWAVIDTEAA